ncbi:MAG: YggS family pyridoxal phosphate-dependent enzyme [Atopobiaceae bacterium]|nr:YggS family pyridoxal phosphate-dependent enzyme [Atopobiaceae bacterium]
MDSYRAFMSERRAQIVERLAQAARTSGRSADDVCLLAVSKTVGIDEVACAWDAGYRVFGENRPQELRRKAEGMAAIPGMEDVRLDMIGNLQTNKINQVIGCAHLVHSVSSLHLAEAISKRAVVRDVRVRILLEINVSGEASKSGFSPSEAREALEQILEMPALDLEGVMTMAPAHDPQAARSTFSGLRELRDTMRSDSGLPLDVLSCGMSDDFGIAVEEGSTLVRLGRIVFDPAYELDV